MSNVSHNHPESEGFHDADTELRFNQLVNGLGNIALPTEWYFSVPKPGFDHAPRPLKPELEPGYKPPASAYNFPAPKREL